MDRRHRYARHAPRAGAVLLHDGADHARSRLRSPGRKILRFNAFERFTHWLTAISFIVLALTGLNYVFGKRLLMPLLGPDAFAAWSQCAKYAHNYVRLAVHARPRCS